MEFSKVRLIVVSTPDIASLIQGEALLELGEWQQGPIVEESKTWSRNDVRMWFLESRLLHEDNLDKRWTNATSQEVVEVIFPSRHFAASGQPSLTVHPIGNPHVGVDEEVSHGGRAGQCPPPSPRLGPWFREILKHQNSELADEFSLTLEATHHGPWLGVPCLFIEIGSSESHWGRRDAAAVLADIIWRGLGLDGGEGIGEWGQEHHSQKVIVGIGGGHYAPFIGRLASNEGIWLGHICANHSLPMIRPTNPEWNPLTDRLPEGNWVQSIDSAIKSTRISFPNADLWVYLDKKSFKGWQRQAIRRHLGAQSIPIGRTIDFLQG